MVCVFLQRYWMRNEKTWKSHSAKFAWVQHASKSILSKEQRVPQNGPHHLIIIFDSSVLRNRHKDVTPSTKSNTVLSKILSLYLRYVREYFLCWLMRTCCKQQQVKMYKNQRNNIKKITAQSKNSRRRVETHLFRRDLNGLLFRLFRRVDVEGQVQIDFLRVWKLNVTWTLQL